LEDNYYIRDGSKYNLKPCIWLFAGTSDDDKLGEFLQSQNCNALALLGSIRSADDKLKDFDSRMTMKPINLKEIEEAPIEKEEEKRVRENYLAVEKIYLGMALARGQHPDLHRVRNTVLNTLKQLEPSITVREIRHLIEKHLISDLGSGEWRNLDEIRGSKGVIEGNRLVDDQNNEWVEIINE